MFEILELQTELVTLGSRSSGSGLLFNTGYLLNMNFWDFLLASFFFFLRNNYQWPICVFLFLSLSIVIFKINFPSVIKKIAISTLNFLKIGNNWYPEKQWKIYEWMLLTQFKSKILFVIHYIKWCRYSYIMFHSASFGQAFQYRRDTFRTR